MQSMKLSLCHPYEGGLQDLVLCDIRILAQVHLTLIHSHMICWISAAIVLYMVESLTFRISSKKTSIKKGDFRGRLISLVVVVALFIRGICRSDYYQPCYCLVKCSFRLRSHPKLPVYVSPLGQFSFWIRLFRIPVASFRVSTLSRHLEPLDSCVFPVVVPLGPALGHVSLRYLQSFYGEIHGFQCREGKKFVSGILLIPCQDFPDHWSGHLSCKERVEGILSLFHSYTICAGFSPMTCASIVGDSRVAF